MATVKENKETITRSRLVGLKDICVAAVTTNDEDVYAADVPVRLAKAIAATVKDTFSVEYTYSDDEVEDTVETYEKTEIELEVNRLTPGDYALLFDTLYKYGFLAKAEGDKAKEVALSLGDIIKANLISSAIINGVKALANGLKTLATAAVGVGSDFESGMSQVGGNE